MIKTIIFFIPLLLISALLLSGCDDVSSPLAGGNPVQPLNVGNEWVFTDSIFNQGSVSTGITKIIVSKKSLVKTFNKEVFEWQVFGDNTLLRTNLVNTAEDGLWHYGEFINGDTLILSKQWAKFPVKTGETFSEPRYNYDPSASAFYFAETWTWTCTTKDYEIKLANGDRLKCIVFETIDGTGARINLIYAPKIGYAGWITWVNNQLVFKETLSSYILK